jgi:hypothetical protein
MAGIRDTACEPCEAMGVSRMPPGDEVQLGAEDERVRGTAGRPHQPRIACQFRDESVVMTDTAACGVLDRLTKTANPSCWRRA